MNKLFNLANLKNKTILVVEDEDFSYLFIYSTLIDQKAKVLRAKNGIEAIDILKENDNISLVLMDIQLPKMNGWDATLKMLEINKEIPIIAQTAYAMKKQKDRCFEVGCVDYISKPYDNNELLRMIMKYI